MTALVALTTAVLGMTIFLLWLIRGAAISRSEPYSWSNLHRIDLLAFRNLLSEDDDQWLRLSLQPTVYRQVRRARLRAAQQYLVWIADNCKKLLLIFHAPNAEPQIKNDEQARLVSSAIQIRLTALSLWCLLWAEYALPGLAIKPYGTLRKYEQFWSRAELMLRPAAYSRASS